MILFLDYDGTLHPSWIFEVGAGRVTANTYEGPWLVEAPKLQQILEPYLPRIEIVISSMWAYTKGLETARRMLPDSLAERVSDSTWLPGMECDYRSALCNRFDCIKWWLEQRRPDYEGPWLALDDDDDRWPADQRHRLVHALGTLSNPQVQSELAAKLSSMIGAE
ncbi:MAG: hypothetical protein H4O13_18860 [Xanthomonadales bacterium]|nr:hypothetical protein [Xanthomonadales bacterium]